MNAPLQFQPYLRPLVWGGRRLGALLGKPLPTGDAYGEAWEVSDHASHQSLVVAGPWAGQSLRTLMRQHKPQLLGPSANGDGVFPWLVKLLDARDWLSVQVHPDDAQAARLWPGERGKTEAWFILDAAPGSAIYAGLRRGVGERELRAALANGGVVDCLHRVEPKPGDCLFFPAGTVHAVGGGVLMAEVQQTSDATFRLYDWDRRDASGQPRTLHVEQALACIDWSRGPVDPIRAEGFPATFDSPAAPGDVTQRLVTCRYFVLDYLRRGAEFAVGGLGKMQVLIVLHGRGRLLTADGAITLLPGASLVLPATMAATRCVPDNSLGLMLSSMP